MRTKIIIRVSLAIVVVALFYCKRTPTEASANATDIPPGNLLAEQSAKELRGLQWMYEPDSFAIKDHNLKVVAGKGTDFFNNPEDSTITATAPLLYKSISGDFVATALVKPDFSSMWNAVALMVHVDNNNWIKFAYENSDATGPSVVTVVTKDVSDDANGVIMIDQEELWLKLVRKGNSYSMLWSGDGNAYKMARLTTLPVVESVKIGLESQCPVGESATHEIKYFGIEERTVEDLRKGE